MSHKVGQPLYANKPHCCFVVGGTFVNYKKPIFVIQVYLVQGYQGLVLALAIVLVLTMDFKVYRNPIQDAYKFWLVSSQKTLTHSEQNGTIYGNGNF